MEHSTLGERIKYHRKRLGLTQEQLAERVRVSAQAVSKWENNLSCPDISVLPELADVFDISLDELLGHSSSAVCEAEPVEESGKDDQSDYSWHWEMPMRKRHSVIFAIFVLLYGGLLLLNNVMSYDVSWWTLLWTLSLCFIGISGLCHGFSFFCLIMALAGSFFLMDAYGFFAFELGWGVLIPAILIIWGISLLLDLVLGKKKEKIKKAVHIAGDGKKKQEYSCTNGWLACEMSFGDHRTAVVTPLLRGGSLECSFGSYTVDFSGCEALAENCRIKIENNFGNLILLVPDHFRVELGSNETFAGDVEIKGSPAPEPQGILTINGESNFGSLEIKYI